MTDPSQEWTESDSQLYQELAAVAVPARPEQLASLLTLLPFDREEAFRVVEIGCGQGILAAALLDCFGRARLTGLDGSALMRTQAAGRLARFGGRAEVLPFELASTDWFDRLDGADAVMSSLCLHHLPDQDKRRLFAAVSQRLPARGALLIADLIEPQRPEARCLFAGSWDRLAEVQALAATGSTGLFERFRQAEWNYYRFPDPADRPAALFDQLKWLEAAGLAVVDCFWLQAGHAIYGGYKSRRINCRLGLTFPVALAAAEQTLRAKR